MLFRSSPFITGELCASLVEGNANARIYTRFDVPLFASGGSSLDQLEALLRSGHQLFKIDDLHAKVVMDESSFVTIGSQNLTKRGKLHNKELTASFTSSQVRDLVKARIAPWLENAEPITAEMIDKALALVGLTDIVKNLPQGLNTPVSDINLSQGQLQLLMIARRSCS